MLGLVSFYAISFPTKLNLFGLWFPHVSNGIIYTLPDSSCEIINICKWLQNPIGRWNAKRMKCIMVSESIDHRIKIGRDLQDHVVQLSTEHYHIFTPKP